METTSAIMQINVVLKKTVCKLGITIMERKSKKTRKQTRRAEVNHEDRTTTQ
jgi:hypothetical protein